MTDHEQTTRTGRQRAVMAAMEKAQPPYADRVQRISGLADGEFTATVRELLNAGVIRRHTAPLGDLLYPTLREAMS